MPSARRIYIQVEIRLSCRSVQTKTNYNLPKREFPLPRRKLQVSDVVFCARLTPKKLKKVLTSNMKMQGWEGEGSEEETRGACNTNTANVWNRQFVDRCFDTVANNVDDGAKSRMTVSCPF